MNEPSSSHGMKPVHLLDLHPGWLACLILALDKKAGLQALSSTCREMRELVFSQAALVPKQRIRTIQDLGTLLHVRALAMAEAATANVHVAIWDACTDPSLLRTRWVDTCTRAASLHAQRTGVAPQLAPVPYQLQFVTSVTLTGAHYLDSLIPDFLVQGCPNLRELTLHLVTITASPPGSPPPICTSLQKLTLRHVGFPAGASLATVKQQLLNLPSLTSLSMDSHDEADFQEGGIYRAAIDRYSSQLQELEASSDELHLPWSPGTQFPDLQHLALPYFSVKSDEVMQQLMQAAPSLVRLQLYSIQGLETSSAQEPCSWQELTLGEVYVDQLAKLPLASCTRIVCNQLFQLSNRRRSKPSLEQIAAGVAAVQAAGGLQFSGRLTIHLYTDDLHLIPTAVPLLEQVNDRVSVGVYSLDTLDFAPWSEVQPVLAALGQPLRCKQVNACAAWSDHPGAYAQLPQLLPHVEGFLCHGRIPDAEVVEMCRAATRPFTLHLYCDQAGLKQQLEQVLQEAGHQLVTVLLAND